MRPWASKVNVMQEQEGNRILFQEVQRFRQAWLWILLVGITSICSGTVLWFFKRQFIDGTPIGEPPMADTTLLLTGGACILANVLFLLFFAGVKLQTEVSDAGLFVRFYPLHRKVRKLDLSEAEGAEAVLVSPLLEYGGWGLRLGRRFTAYNISGNEGLRIYYTNGCHVFVGSQHAEALEAAVHEITGGALRIQDDEEE